MGKLEGLRKQLRKIASPDKAKKSALFFKTEKGQYGYGDKFLGVTVPEQRMVAKKFADLDLLDLETLMKSEFHEERLTALLILVDQYKKGDTRKKDEIFEFYLSHSKNVNNWDLVDSSAPSILGMHLQEKKITLLIMYAKSGDLWRKRIAIVSTLAFIQNKNPTPTFQIADLLLSEKEDLIQKAIGWMLREVGKRISYEVEEEYLKKNYKKMGRTTLRYAIEHFSPEKRKKYLNGII